MITNKTEQVRAIYMQAISIRIRVHLIEGAREVPSR